MQDSPEILVKIKVTNMEIIEKRFHTCEEAWAWDRDVKRYHNNRRAIKDRKNVIWSFYCGCTCYGNSYGGYLTGNASSHGVESLLMAKNTEKFEASNRSNWKSPGVPYANLV